MRVCAIGGTGHIGKNLTAMLVEAGGALLVHHSVGYMPTARAAFAEVAEAPDFVPITAMKVVADHRVANGDATVVAGEL